MIQSTIIKILDFADANKLSAQVKCFVHGLDTLTFAVDTELYTVDDTTLHFPGVVNGVKFDDIICIELY